MDQMPPPPPRHAAGKPPAAAMSGLRRQALLNTLHHSTGDSLLGPLSTIPDSAAVNGDEGEPDIVDGIPAAVAMTSSMPELHPWDHYYDDMQDIALEERGGTFRIYTAGTQGPVLFCLHGCGYTGLTWALVAAAVKDRCRVVALDMRGHGETVTGNDRDLSSETLAQDAVAVWQAVLGAEAPPTVLVGHSMGGAVAVWAAALKAVPSLEGLVVIDVVEGTALACLPHMSAVLARRPPSFPSLRVALEWAQHSGTCKNREAAAVSLPSQLARETAVDRERWVLLLAGTDRLDRELTIGQMQGRFQMVLLPQAGHAIQEDEPARTAEVLRNFLQRFRIGQPKEAIPRPAAAGVVLPVAAGPAFAAPQR